MQTNTRIQQLIKLGGLSQDAATNIADVIHQEIAQHASELVTKSDLKLAIVELRSELKSDIAELKTEVKTDIAEIRGEIKGINRTIMIFMALVTVLCVFLKYA